MPTEGFITFEQLTTFPTQVYAVLLITQAVKALRPQIGTYWLRFTAFFVGIDVALAVTLLAGAWTWQALLLAPMNGLIVALTAMKTAEFIKGVGNGGASSPAP